MTKIGTKTYSALILCYETAAELLRKLFSWLSNTMSSLYNKCKDTLKEIWLKVISVFSSFCRKYWLIIPAGLSFNASFIFVKTAIATRENVKGQVYYILGAWTLLVIGCTVLHASISSPGYLVQQRIEINRSLLRYIDLHLFSAVYKIVGSGWHALGALLRTILHSVDVIIRVSSKHVWKLQEQIYERAAMPLIRSFVTVLRDIWNSPYLSIFSSLVALSIMYIHHLGFIAITTADIKAATQGLYYLVFVNIPDKCRECHRYIPSILTSTLSVLAKLYGNVYEPLLVTGVPSESAALSCWIFTCIISKTRDRVRIKTFAIPVVVFYITSTTTTEFLRASIVSLLIWFALSLFVDMHEQRQRQLTEIAYTHFRQQHRSGHQPQTMTDNKKEMLSPESNIISTFDQTECCICLDEFEHGKCKMSELPCGHRFHSSCIQEWLNNSNIDRCPLCRRATGGWGRLIEVAF